MKVIRKAGATSNILQIFIADSSSTTGAGLTGLTNASSGLTAYYHRDTDTTATAISLVSMTVGTFTSSGFKEIDATNMPGWYQFCPPDAALASGAKSVGFHLKGATNMAPLPIEVDLWAVDPQTATNFGLSALPTASPGAANGVLIAGSNAATTISGLTLTGAAASGATPATAGLTVTGGAASTSSGGISAAAASFTGGAGAASTNGSAAGISTTAGGTTTVSGNDGIICTGTSAGNGLSAVGGSTGAGIKATGGSSSGDGILTSTTSGHGATFAGTGTTKHGINATGGATSSDGIRATGGGTGHGLNLQSGSGATGNGLNSVSNASNGSGATLTSVGTGKDLNAQTTNNLQVNPTQWASGAIPSPNVTGVPLVDTKYLLGTIYSTPATAGIMDINVKNMNNVAATSITTINANQGTTQPINFTGTAGSALVKGDVIDIAGTTSAGAAGYVGVDWGQVANKTTTNALTGTTISTSQAVASVSGAVGSVTGNVGGNVAGSVGSVSGNVGGNILGSVAGSVNSVVSAVAITSNRKKGSTATFEFTMQDSTTGADKTGLTVAGVISKDGGSFTSTTNSVTETGDGWYQIVLTASEMTANNIALQFTATGATTRDIFVQTQP